MAKQFTAKAMDIDLDLTGSSKEQKVFTPKERVTGDFADRVISETKIYIAAQNGIPISEQDSLMLGNLKFLDLVYKDFNLAWVKKNFTGAEIEELKQFTFLGLSGVKKDGEN